MILLNDISKKIQAVLDGTDTEIPNGVSKPTDLDFVVKTAGFHLDNIYNKKAWKNFIPVFVTSLGGQFNPVPQLKEKTQSVGITFWFPVRFKNEIDVLCNYMADVFVGTYLTYYGTHKCVSNLSVPQIGEIQDLDLQQFASWTEKVYQQVIDVTQPYLSVSMTLYIKDAGEEFVYGNEASISLTVSKGSTTYTDNSVAFDGTSIQSNSTPAAEQLIGASHPETQGLPANTAYSSSFTVYYKNTAMYQFIFDEWSKGDSQLLSFDIGITIGTKTFSRTAYLQSCNLNAQKGQLITLTFAFGKKIS